MTCLQCRSVLLLFAHLQVFGTFLPGKTMYSPESMWSFSSISLLLTIPFTFPLWPCILCFIFSAPLLYTIVILFIIPSTLFVPLHLNIQLCSIYHPCLVSIFSLSSLHALQPISPQSPFQHLVSISPLIYLSCWAPTRSDALPLCLCCMCVICIPLPAIVKLIALCKAPLAPPKPLTMLAVTGARPLKITLHWVRSLSTDLFPADVANAA